MNDNILGAFQGYQQYLSSSGTVTALQLTFLAIFMFNLVGYTAHWFKFSKKITFPVTFIIFFIVKLISDISLSIEQPKNVLWSETIISKTGINHDQLFLANIDPFIGILAISFFYNFSIGKLSRAQ
jgi:hypothetical protein